MIRSQRSNSKLLRVFVILKAFLGRGCPLECVVNPSQAVTHGWRSSMPEGKSTRHDCSNATHSFRKSHTTRNITINKTICAFECRCSAHSLLASCSQEQADRCRPLSLASSLQASCVQKAAQLPLPARIRRVGTAVFPLEVALAYQTGAARPLPVGLHCERSCVIRHGCRESDSRAGQDPLGRVRTLSASTDAD